MARPNPFRSDVALGFALPRPAEVTVAVYDLAGRRVRMVRRGQMAAGEQRLRWDGRDDAGRASAPGVYLIRARSADWGAAGRVLRLR